MKFNTWQIIGVIILAAGIILYARRRAIAPTTPPANTTPATATAA